MEDNMNQRKPPIGVMPRRFWLMERKDALFEAMCRYREVYMKFPQEWLIEYNQIVDELLGRYKQDE